MTSRWLRPLLENVLPSSLMPILLLVGVFYITFVSRIVFAPLLPLIEGDLGMGHAEAGSLFLLIAVGYCAGLFTSGFFTSHFNHRHTILFSAGVTGLSMLALSQVSSVAGMYLGLVFAGISSGFYLPSGIAVLTDLVSKEHWGKAIAIHELAPNLSFISAPLLVEALLKIVSWRGTLGLLGAGSILMGAVFLMFGSGGRHKGASPHLSSIREIMRLPFFWVMGGFFTVSVGASLGVYSMMPLFFVSELGMDRELANTLTGFSRISGALILFLSGWMIDRFGQRAAMFLFVTTTGLLTFLMGLVHSQVMTPVLAFLQAISAVCLFPVGFILISVTFPAPLRNLAVSLVLLIGILIGGGVIPLGIGYLAEISSFSLSFSLLGIFMLGLLPFMLRVDSRSP